MKPSISTNTFTSELLFLLSETFESVHGIYLDGGTSLLETLEGITAAEASIPVGNSCATIAAQVMHVCFYLDVLDRYLKTGENEKVDWGEVWRTVRGVTPEEWLALQERLRQIYVRTQETIKAYQRWDVEHSVGGAIGLIAHTAYHLGEIRQAACTVKK
ncbi:MAG: hypothetical protein IH586_18510 [Anaerolineaceae bacterium]|nr:hypothetical protein [Anaerolineaceae bacterium]